jgi:hypothetical protein
VTHPGEHLADEILSTLIDDRLMPDEARDAGAHLEGCSTCQARRDELQSVVSLLRALPSLDVPRTFVLGPRPVADPPNVVRLRRWYTVTRAAAASLAAAFVFLSLGSLYVDSRPAASPTTLSAPAQSAPVAVQPGAAARSSEAAQPAPGAAGGDAADQTAAATRVGPLPTQVPTSVPLPPTPAPLAKIAPTASLDTAAPLRIAAVLVGVLAVLGVLAALIVRHRLASAANLPLE